MSSSERRTGRALIAVALLAALAGVSACTVRPLYQDPTAYASGNADVVAELASVAVKPVETRVAQEVRNHLIFALNHGAGQPAEARYSLELVVAAATERAAVVQVADENEPTAGTVTVTGGFKLTESATGKVVSQGRRSIPASYDVARQEFAALRAVRDAENRAARELAQLISLVLAQDVARNQ